MSRLSGRHVILGLLLSASIFVLAYSLRSGISRSGDRPGGLEAASSTAEPLVVATAPDGVPDDTDFSRYRRLANTNVFSKQRSVPPPKQEKTPLPPPPPFNAAKTTPPPPKGPDFSGWSYTGYFMVDGVKSAIIQNDSSDTCQFIPVGGKFLGATVEEVTGTAMRLKHGSSVTTLRTPDVFSLVPLDKGPSPSGQPARPNRP